jgi:T-complex protein 1 subunit theta
LWSVLPSLNCHFLGTIKHVSGAKVAVFTCGIDLGKPETKGTVLIKTAEQLKNFTKEEEAQMEDIIRAIANTGAKVNRTSIPCLVRF